MGTLYGSHTHLYINPSGKFIIGGRQVRSIHLQADGQVCREERPEQAMPRAAFIRHRCCKATLTFFVETYGAECGALSPDDITNILKIELLPSWRHCLVLGTPGTKVPRDCSLLPLRSPACHQRRHQILRVGECCRSFKILATVLGAGDRRTWCQQLPHKVG